MAEYTDADIKRILDDIRREYEEAHRREEHNEDDEDFECDDFCDEDFDGYDEEEAVLVDVESRDARSIAASGTLDELIAWARGVR